MDRLAEMRMSRLESGGIQPQIFESIQGEGRSIGVPSTFIRLADCNLACSWCDVPETWRFAGSDAADMPHDYDTLYDKDVETVVTRVNEIATAVANLRPRNVVITGGEPLLQQRAFNRLIPEILQHDDQFTFEVETNGTIVPSNDAVRFIRQFNVSPKLAGSGNNLKRRNNVKALQTFAQLESADFKFVVSNDDDIAEVLTLVDSFNIPPRRVFIMPEGITREAIEDGQRELVDYCLNHGFTLTNRLHLTLFGNKRGT
jgi:organic radical activating enzyme